LRNARMQDQEEDHQEKENYQEEESREEEVKLVFLGERLFFGGTHQAMDGSDDQIEEGQTQNVLGEHHGESNHVCKNYIGDLKHVEGQVLARDQLGHRQSGDHSQPEHQGDYGEELHPLDGNAVLGCNQDSCRHYNAAQRRRQTFEMAPTGCVRQFSGPTRACR